MSTSLKAEYDSLSVSQRRWLAFNCKPGDPQFDAADEASRAHYEELATLARAEYARNVKSAKRSAAAVPSIPLHVAAEHPATPKVFTVSKTTYMGREGRTVMSTTSSGKAYHKVFVSEPEWLAFKSAVAAA